MTHSRAHAPAYRRVLIPERLEMRARPAGITLHALGGQTMGTTWSVKVAAPHDLDIGLLRAAIAGELELVNRQMSSWRSDSDISHFSNAPAETWHELPEEFFGVLSRAHALAVETGGAYDPTAGHIVNLWGFGPLPPEQRPPSADAIAGAIARSGYRKLMLEGTARRAYQPGDLTLDLSSIAKGFAVDQIVQALARRGLHDHLVEIGGELRGGGMKPDGSPWWVTIETPGIETETTVALHGLAVATSGESQRYFDHAGKRYAHTLDPRTGAPVGNGMISATVLDETCERADALATALTVLGPQEGPRWAEERRIAALFVWREHRRIREWMSSRLAALAA